MTPTQINNILSIKLECETFDEKLSFYSYIFIFMVGLTQSIKGMI